MTAIIPINDQVRIQLDQYSWQVSKWKRRKNHKSGGTWQGFSWHNRLQEAGEAVQRQILLQDDLEGVQQVIEALHSSSQLIALAIASSEFKDRWADAVRG
jgi:hypothetical protein